MGGGREGTYRFRQAVTAAGMVRRGHDGPGSKGYGGVKNALVVRCRRDFLENYVRWAPTPLEQTESLEQLRALENGARIRVILTDHVSVGVDTPEQAEQVEQILLNIH